jgi:hypothetical protein
VEHTKLANGAGHEVKIRRSRSQMTTKGSESKKAGPETTARGKAKPARPLRSKTASKSKPEKLICRYCGSDDLAPSFIRRGDRRCRKCFSRRYGSTAGARKVKVKK